eukprot:COSAG06_NODE_13996_length_1198_cov_3.802548_2_plen_205_part_00
MLSAARAWVGVWQPQHPAPRARLRLHCLQGRTACPLARCAHQRKHPAQTVECKGACERERLLTAAVANASARVGGVPSLQQRGQRTVPQLLAHLARLLLRGGACRKVPNCWHRRTPQTRGMQKPQRLAAAARPRRGGGDGRGGGGRPLPQRQQRQHSRGVQCGPLASAWSLVGSAHALASYDCCPDCARLVRPRVYIHQAGGHL